MRQYGKGFPVGALALLETSFASYVNPRDCISATFAPAGCVLLSARLP